MRATWQERHRVAPAWILVVSAVSLAGCATVPKGRFGVNHLEIAGMEDLDDEALESCLATEERPVFRLCAGCNASASCGVPPFDSGRLSLIRVQWPWTEWPLFDRSVFERDLDRVLRWFRARGYYDAEIVDVSVTPPEALTVGVPQDDREASANTDNSACDGVCEVDIRISVKEGLPVRVRQVTLLGMDGLPESVREALRDRVSLAQGDRFDEAVYDAVKIGLVQTLSNLTYAHARVAGEVSLDRGARLADITFHVDSGPPCVFGEITIAPIDPGPDCNVGSWTIVENQRLPLDVIRATALLEGDGANASLPYRAARITEAQRAIYELGTFSSVEVVAEVPDDRTNPVIPVTIRTIPGRTCRFGVGVGFLSGLSPQLGSLVDNLSTPRWDLHLSVTAEARNFLGGLRRLRIEEQPRVIFQDSFPNATEPTLGNLVRIEFRQPGFFEPRTTLVVRSDWDLGPDQFQSFFRHSVNALAGPERLFLDGRLFVGVHLGAVIQVPITKDSINADDWHALYLQETLRLDLRDNPSEPSSGFFAQLTMQQAGVIPASSWNYFRFQPEGRFYLPLPLGIVFAFRAGLGALLITDNDQSLNQAIALRGPNPFRLRGGGPTSVRGYVAGGLGDSGNGGLRNWEVSAELRVPLTNSFLAALFLDVGDVHSGLSADGLRLSAPRFRLDVPHLSLGFGLRYRTPIGPFRVDFGWAVTGLQNLSGDPAELITPPRTVLGLFPGAVHITVGEAF